jgi:hypothetical protein
MTAAMRSVCPAHMRARIAQAAQLLLAQSAKALLGRPHHDH